MSARLHGDPLRFDAVAEFVFEEYGRSIRHIADVAGGQGMLSRLLRKRYNYSAEVVDPRTWRLRGIAGESRAFHADEASYYDLIIGLHPDEATRAVAHAALERPVVLVPCCNFWDRSQKLGRDALLESIEVFYAESCVGWRRVTLAFRGPMNVALVSAPPSGEA